MYLPLGEATAGTWQSVIETVEDTFTGTNVTAVLTAAVGSAMALVFLWWGARTATKIIKRAFMRGKLRF